MNIIVASRSDRRKQILEAHGFTCTMVPAQGVEEVEGGHRPSYLVKHNAQTKARAVKDTYPHDIIIGADTIIYFRNAIIGKPRSRAHAEEILAQLQGQKHYVYSGVCVLPSSTSKEYSFYDKTAVTFKALTRSEIKRYLALTKPMDKAGAYAIQEHGDMIIDSINGSIENVIGFPFEKFEACLAQHLTYLR